MNTIEAIRDRVSVRKYLDMPIEFDKLTLILEAGACAPSAGNLQNWKFILVTDRVMIQSLYDHTLHQECVYNARALIILCALPDKSEKFYGLRGKRLYSVQNCAAAAQNMLLAAKDLGLGACWVGAFDEDKLAETFGIPGYARPQVILTLGYPGEEPRPTLRTNLESLVYFNHYGSKIKNVHLVLRDYSVEWERKAKEAGELSEKTANTVNQKIDEGLKKIKEKIREFQEKKKQPKDRSEENP